MMISYHVCTSIKIEFYIDLLPEFDWIDKKKLARSKYKLYGGNISHGQLLYGDILNK
jgi:hypothetical protein